MFDDYKICPYTGLRSFTEDESIYFKGRDEHIDEATEQLARNKFLMLTGASGEGKSSLVYAGIIPNAKAGFLKATYTQWCVADFRPERSPFKNLCASLATQMQIKDASIVESELSHGFSSLVEFYKNSIRYHDTDSYEWEKANDDERAALKRRAANLIILADQFEEFFTNPENYTKGKPSTESSLVVNLLLETAKIALEEGLPIYVIFTMRSDYIGQCAAFRGLPESIGFSQFFVPRLNRKELLDVVEEPAVLSGNKITRRLTDRLVHDIIEGIDQLPLLQHALSQIWVAANNGEEELDLIHYAMVGGLSADELPDEDKERFNKWFSNLPENIKSCFHEPKLQNVLDSHANKLLETSTEYYKEKSGKQISREQTFTIVKTAFTCLTKIDQSRAVRNRITLGEIHRIINDPEIGIDKVKIVLNLFREPGNTLVRPFISEDSDSVELQDEEVLDITHESLIRNWELLKEWANEEYEHYVTFQDFYQQVSRWKKNDNSSGFLLPLGTLIHFEDWATAINPNPHWINRYLKSSKDDDSLPQAKSILKDSLDYLEKSSSKHTFSRWVMKVGMGKIAAGLAVLILVIITSFSIVEQYQRTNDVILKTIDKDALVSFPKAMQKQQSFFLIELVQRDFNQIDKYLSKMETPEQKLIAVSNTGGVLIDNDHIRHNDLKQKLLTKSNKLVNEFELSDDPEVYNNSLKALATYMVFLTEYAYFNPDSTSAKASEIVSEVSKKFIYGILDNKFYTSLDVRSFNKCVQLALNLGAFSQSEINILISYYSPWNSNTDSTLLNELYSKEKTYVTGKDERAVDNNGLYQLLAEFYASTGDLKNTIKCIDILYENHSDYAEFRPNDISFATYFLKYNHLEAFSGYISYLSERYSISRVEILKMFSERVGLNTDSRWNNLNDDYWENPIMLTVSFKDLNTLFEFYLNDLKTISNEDARNYELATFYKLKGTKLSLLDEYHREDYSSIIKESYSAFIEYYGKINDKYLNKTVLSFIEYENIEPVKRKNIIEYPDYRDKYFIDGKSVRSLRYKSTSFIDFILRNGHFDLVYDDSESLALITYWLQNYLRNDIFSFVQAPKINVLKNLEKKLSEIEESYKLDLNALRLAISQQNFKSGKHENSVPYLENMDPSTLSNMYIVLTGPDNESLFRVITEAYISAVLSGNSGLARKIMDGITQLRNKVVMYGAASYHLYLTGNSSLSKTYLDSTEQIIEQVPFFNAGFTDCRKHYLYALYLNNGNQSLDTINPLLKGADDGTKGIYKVLMARSNAFQGDLFEAVSLLSPFNSSTYRLTLYSEVLRYYDYGNTGVDSSWYEYYKKASWPFEVYSFNKF